MKRLFAIAFSIFAIALFSFGQAAFAADPANGAKIFSANCVACHTGGGNVVNPAKTLSKADLDKNGKASVEAIKTQVTNGAGAMPGFGGRLSPSDIEDVATYVLSQAEKGW